MCPLDAESKAPEAESKDRRQHALRTILLDAETAHHEGSVTYDDVGVMTITHRRLLDVGLPETMLVPPKRQFPAIRATFEDLNKALSSLSNSPALDDGRTLRQSYEEELERYEALVASALAARQFEPGYGTYVVDHHRGDVYLIAPERWHRLALVTSNARLLTDPAGALSWQELRRRLESAVIGFAGVSVGSNVLEGWLREARPRAVKIADPDWIELTNFNRCERVCLRHLVGSRARRFDLRNPYEVHRVSKAQYVAYEAQMVDPYLDCWVYDEGLTRGNLDRFFGGDVAHGGTEPPIDILVEEMDNVDLKILARQTARARGVDVLMMSDFGHRADMLWNYFSEDRTSPMGRGASDDVLLALLEASRAGDRGKFMDFVASLCGDSFAGDEFGAFVEGRGEQPTASMPQSGATAMTAGGIGGKEVALRVLGHGRGRPSPCRVVYDLLGRSVTRD
jgi:hypothetical protein